MTITLLINLLSCINPHTPHLIQISAKHDIGSYPLLILLQNEKIRRRDDVCIILQ